MLPEPGYFSSSKSRSLDPRNTLPKLVQELEPAHLPRAAVGPGAVQISQLRPLGTYFQPFHFSEVSTVIPTRFYMLDNMVQNAFPKNVVLISLKKSF